MLSLKKKMLMAGKKPAASPFNLSGGWETGDEGWAFTSVLRGTGYSPRSGSFSLYASASGSRITYTFPAGTTHGLRIAASVYARDRGAADGSRTLFYRVNSGPETTVASIGSTGTAYALLSGSFLSPATKNDTLSIVFTASVFANGIYFDDWEITGVKP